MSSQDLPRGSSTVHDENTLKENQTEVVPSTSESGVGYRKQACVIYYRQSGIIVTLLLFAMLTPAQFVAAIIINSMVLLGISASLVFDTLSYGINLWAECDQSAHQPQKHFTASALSFFFLVGITGYNIYYSCLVLLGVEPDDEDVNQNITFGFSLVGTLFDLICLLALEWGRKKERSTRAGDLNIYSAELHVFADLVRNIMTLVVSALILFSNFENRATDAWVALIVSILILVISMKMIRECVFEYLKSVGGDKEVLPLINARDAEFIRTEVLRSISTNA